MPQLDFSKFTELAQNYNLIPVFEELPADLETPVSAFLKIRTGEYDFLFESVVGGETWGRYSFLGTRPKRVYYLEQYRFQTYDPVSKGFSDATTIETPLEALRLVLDDVHPYQDPKLPRFFGGLVGFFAYDSVKYFEKVQLTKPRLTEVPDMCFLHTDAVVIFDNRDQVMRLVYSVAVPDAAKSNTESLRALYDEALATLTTLKTALQKPLSVSASTEAALPSSGEVKALLSEHEFCDRVEAAQAYIEAGDVFQVVLSNRFEITTSGQAPFSVYRRLRRQNPSPYLFYLQMQDVTIVGASPEVLVRLEDGDVTVRPIAGTRPRGKTPEDDLAFEQELLADEKENAEHVMLVDLGRNDVGRVAEIGSVRVSQNKFIERYSHVMHMVSEVQGILKSDKDVFDLLAAVFPAGTLSGAPKVRAMEVIDELEKSARGIYGGAVGYVSFTKNADLAIAIRSVVFSGDAAVVQAGAGIVADSDPQKEYQECLHKAQGIVNAIRGV